MEEHIKRYKAHLYLCFLCKIPDLDDYETYYQSNINYLPEISDDVNSVTNNPNISVEFIKTLDVWYYPEYTHQILTLMPELIYKNMDMNWDYKILSEHIPKDIFIKHADKHWNHKVLLTNENLDIDTILRNIPDILDYSQLQSHPSITMDIVRRHPGVKWSDWLKNNPNITYDVAAMYINMSDYLNLKCLSYHIDISDILAHPKHKWNVFDMSRNKSVTMDIVLETNHKKTDISRRRISWHFLNLSANTSISFEDKIKYRNLPWDWNVISELAPMDIIWSNPDIKWNYSYMSANENLRLQDLLEHSDITWEWDIISQNNAFTWEMLRAFPDVDWDFEYISRKSPPTDITIKYIDKWNFHYLSDNENLTFDIVAENLDKNWNYDTLLLNPFNGENEKLYNTYRAAVKIQKWYDIVRYNPIYKNVRDRLHREYEELIM